MSAFAATFERIQAGRRERLDTKLGGTIIPRIDPDRPLLHRRLGNRADLRDRYVATADDNRLASLDVVEIAREMRLRVGGC